MADMLIDDVKFTACLDAEADAIRAKTGDSNDIPFDYANNKGFADAIAAIPSGGGNIVESSGTFTLSNQTTDYEILHGLERAPFLAMVWASENVYVSGKHVVGGYSALLGTQTLETDVALGNKDNISKLGFYTEEGGYTQAPLIESISSGNYVKNFSSTSFHLTSSSAYPIPAGVEFKWQAFAMMG